MRLANRASGNNLLPGGTAIANRFLFTGREWNPVFKFYEYRARAYSPSLGRFTSEDPKGFDAGDYNLYRYVGNDPINKTDPTGLYVEYTKGTPSFWKSWEKQFEKRWQDPVFRSWWSKVVGAKDPYVAGPKGERGSTGKAATAVLPRTMPRATDGRSAADRASQVPPAARRGANLTHYGYEGDPYSDSNTRLGLGSANNILNPDSVALSPDRATGVPFGASVNVDGHFIGFFHDRTASDLRNRVDVYDPDGTFR